MTAATVAWDSDNDEEGAAGDDEARLLKEIAQHEADMKALAKNDPAFYAHLKENDAELLTFNRDDVMADDDEGGDGATEDKAGKGKQRKTQPTGQLSTR